MPFHENMKIIPHEILHVIFRITVLADKNIKKLLKMLLLYFGPLFVFLIRMKILRYYAITLFTMITRSW